MRSLISLLLQLLGPLALALILLALFGCAPSQGWHTEQIWTNMPDPSAHLPSWRAGRFVFCEVQDRTYVVRRCF